MQKYGRNQVVDGIRAVSLIGICIVNMTIFGDVFTILPRIPESTEDKISIFILDSFLVGKFVTLFSFLFGWSIYAQYKATLELGASFSAQYWRRLCGLAVLGVVNIGLISSFDILLSYAILGALMWWFRRFGPKTLIWLACVFLGASLVMPLLFFVTLPAEIWLAWEFGSKGSFLQASQHRLQDWSTIFMLNAFTGWPLMLTAMTAGLAAAKVDFFARANPCRQRLSKALPWLLLIGLAANVYATATTLQLVVVDGQLMALLVYLITQLGVIMLSMSYLLLLSLWLQSRRIPQFAVLAGRNSLSVYILQGVFASLIFADYGLGLFGEFGPTILMSIGFVVALITMGTIGLFASAFGRGPLEIALRRLTYW